MFQFTTGMSEEACLKQEMAQDKKLHYFCAFVLIFKGLQMDEKNKMRNRKNVRESKTMQMSVSYWNQRELQMFTLTVNLSYCFLMEPIQAVFIVYQDNSSLPIP